MQIYQSKKDQSKLFLKLFISILVISFSFSIYNCYIAKNKYGIKIDNKLLKNITYEKSSPSHYKQETHIKLQHQHSEQEHLLNNVILKIKDIHDNILVQQVHPNNINNLTLTHSIKKKADKIKYILFQSENLVKIKSNGRLLQTVQQSTTSYSFIGTFVTYFTCFCRNLIILATITNSFDLFMPLLMFVQCFVCLGLWTHDTHYFTNVFTNIYTSNVDIFNLIRSKISSQSDISSNAFLASYGLTDKFIINCSGQMILFVIFTIVIVILKILGILSTSQKLRTVNAKARPIWNGYLFWFTPRILSMAGFSLRLSTSSEGAQIFHKVIAAVGIFIVILNFVFLLLQVRKINSSPQFIEQTKNQIGLVNRLKHNKDFEFDCLEYSMLYYPVMNLGRLIFGHLCLGFAPDFHYVQFGGIIAAQVFYLMIQISSPGYKEKRDKFMFPIIDFFYIVFLLIFIMIGLVYSVGHIQLTTKLEQAAFSILFLIVLMLIGQTIADIVQSIRQKKTLSLAELQNSAENQKITQQKNYQFLKRTKNQDNVFEKDSLDKLQNNESQTHSMFKQKQTANSTENLKKSFVRKQQNKMPTKKNMSLAINKVKKIKDGRVL